MEEVLTNLIEKRKKALFYYNPYNFLKELDSNTLFKVFIKDKILKFASAENHYVYCENEGENIVVFLFEYLPWDSDFLKRKSFKLFTVLYLIEDAELIFKAITSFKNYLLKKGFTYGFIDISAEDILLIQILTNAGLRLVETRLHFYKDNLQEYKVERFHVRMAAESDLKEVAKIAKESRNNYDRLHADFKIPNELADEYLEVYAKAAVNGFCDLVLVPAENELPVASFLAINHLKADAEKLNTNFARIVLTAVAPANKGWHYKLVSETIYYAREKGAAYILMTTQSTNRAVFRTCEKLDFKVGAVSHILAFSF